MAQNHMLGPLVDGLTPPSLRRPNRMDGQFVTLELLEADAHAADLFQALSVDPSLWDYM